MNGITQFLTKNKGLLLIAVAVIVILYFAYKSGGSTFQQAPYTPGEGGNISPTFDAENAARNLYTGLEGGTSYTEFAAILEGLLLLTDDELIELSNAYIALYGKTAYPTVSQNITAESTWLFLWPWQMTNANSLRDQVLQRFNNLNIY